MTSRAMKVSEVAEALGIDRTTAHRKLQSGAIPVRVLRLGDGPGAPIRVPRDAFEDWQAGKFDKPALTAAVEELIAESGATAKRATTKEDGAE